MKRWILAISCVTAFGFPVAQAKPKSSPRTVIENFYREYLKYLDAGDKKAAPPLAYSKSFVALLDRNREVCAKHAGTDVCGFGADGDTVLDAQEYKPGTPENAGLKVKDLPGNQVQVELDVYPGVKDAGTFYKRKIVYSMILEGGEWVVDDIRYQSGTARKEMTREIEAYLPKPARGKAPKKSP